MLSMDFRDWKSLVQISIVLFISLVDGDRLTEHWRAQFVVVQKKENRKNVAQGINEPGASTRIGFSRNPLPSRVFRSINEMACDFGIKHASVSSNALQPTTTEPPVLSRWLRQGTAATARGAERGPKRPPSQNNNRYHSPKVHVAEK